MEAFEWWYFFDAYAPKVFERGGIIAASSGLLATSAAIGVAVWRARLAKQVTTYCVFRKSVTGDFGIVTDDFGNVTGHFGDVTDVPSSGY